MAQYQHLPIYKQTYDTLLRTMTATKDAADKGRHIQFNRSRNGPGHTIYDAPVP
jgi:hypothetical protein